MKIECEIDIQNIDLGIIEEAFASADGHSFIHVDTPAIAADSSKGPYIKYVGGRPEGFCGRHEIF